MIYQQKNETEEDIARASYLLGTSNSLKVKFDFKIPVIPDNYLVPVDSIIELLDASSALIPPRIERYIDSIPWTEINATNLESGTLYYQTTFAINGSISNSLLEKYLKKCKTTYSVKGGQDGLKEFHMPDSIHITANKQQLIMRKYITLNR